MKGDLYESHDLYDEIAAKVHEDWRYLTDTRQKSLAFVNLEQLLGQAMQAWEAVLLFETPILNHRASYAGLGG